MKSEKARGNTRRTQHQQGGMLIEALLSLAILGFGLLALSKFHLSLTEAISAGRERTEATLHAQDELDRLRSFDLLNHTGGAPQFGYNQITSTAAAALSATGYVATYNRATTVTNDPLTLTWSGVSNTPSMKLALVNMAWSDKLGQARALALPTILARADPADAAWLIACQSDATGIRCGVKDTIKTPYNRSLQIPFPAKDLGGGKSSFAPPGAPYTRLVFNNLTGIIEQRCTDSNTTLSDDVLSAYADCSTLNGYLLSGFISAGESPRNPTSVNINSANTISVSVTLTQGSLHECFDDSLETTGRLNANFVTYSCIIIPVDHDASDTTPQVWSGKSTLTGLSIGTGPSNDKVCRFDQNGDHPETYSLVKESLENQNFIVILGNKNCSSSAHEIQHQP